MRLFVKKKHENAHQVKKHTQNTNRNTANHKIHIDNKITSQLEFLLTHRHSDFFTGIPNAKGFEPKSFLHTDLSIRFLLSSVSRTYNPQLSKRQTSETEKSL